jgi:hypothetical protein
MQHGLPDGIGTEDSSVQSTICIEKIAYIRNNVKVSQHRLLVVAEKGLLHSAPENYPALEPRRLWRDISSSLPPAQTARIGRTSQFSLLLAREKPTLLTRWRCR